MFIRVPVKDHTADADLLTTLYGGRALAPEWNSETECYLVSVPSEDWLTLRELLTEDNLRLHRQYFDWLNR